MLDKQDLQAIAQLMDDKLSMQRQETMHDVKSLMAEQKQEIMHDVKSLMTEQKQDIMHDVKSLMTEQKQEIMHEVNVLIENLVIPKFNLLAEGQQAILEKLVPRSRVDELEDEIKFLKIIIRQINDDVQTLKKAQ